MRLALCLLFLVGCLPLGPDLSDAEPIPPPEHTAESFAVIVACVGFTEVRYSDLRWHVVYRPAIETSDGPRGGLRRGRDLYLIDRLRDNKYLANHEMLHAILDDNSHDRPEWERCL